LEASEMFQKLLAQSILPRVVISFLSSVPVSIWRKKIINNEDPKDIFLDFIRTAPEWMLDIDPELLEEVRKHPELFTYKNMVIWAYRYNRAWFEGLKDLLLSEKGKKWFDRYVMGRLREWLTTGRVRELEGEMIKILEERGLFYILRKYYPDRY